MITTNQTPRSYWIQVQGVEGDCAVAFQRAILKYEDSSEMSPPELNVTALFDSLHHLPVSVFKNEFFFY